MQQPFDCPPDEAETTLAFHKDGFLVVSGLFTEQETDLVGGIFAAGSVVPSPKTIREADGGVRSQFFEAGDSPLIDAFVRQRRMLRWAEALLGSKVYAYQVKINSKLALSGEAWPWHQDYIFWREKDGLPTPRVLTAGVFLDEATQFSGPMYFVPGSHCFGVLPTIPHEAPADDYTNDLTRDLSFQLAADVIEPLVTRFGMASATGKAGSVVFFDGNVAHCSPNNLSPFDRKILFITYCSVENVPRVERRRRPNFLSNRDASSLEPLDAAQLLSVA